MTRCERHGRPEELQSRWFHGRTFAGERNREIGKDWGIPRGAEGRGGVGGADDDVSDASGGRWMLAGVKDGGGLLRSRTDASIWDEIKYCTLSKRCAKTKYEERKRWEGSELPRFTGG